ncbi:energy transducer TonB [Hymenobacter sp. YC55]|uniref:energy transducer TonB n=1 Tax=Hymenobacter sp. YC55 TaxID=3034019 RepID=UPI0023F8E636|nr:energy transducer TonB [Hymenobacter sp. YC55]MDF7812933.1 TonB family protein [Hymenobacter sp. YC55]
MQNQFFLLFACLLVAFPLICSGQDTKKVLVKSKNSNYREEYSVLKTAPTLKHGRYMKYEGGFLRKTIVSGYYTNGKKDSLWTEYSWNHKSLWSKGRYHNDQKVGIWEYYSFTGELEQKYDYTRHQLLFNKPSSLELKVTFKSLMAGVALDANPVYIGGLSTAYAFITKNIRYPAIYLRSQVDGTVRIAFTITSNGETTNYRVARPIASGLDEEAMRVVKLLPATWLPASIGGKPVAAECELPVTFRIN